MVLYKVGIVLHPVAQRIEETGFQSAEAVVIAWDVGLGELECIRVSLSGQTVDDGAAGVAQFHHLGTLVDGFACGIVDGLADDFHILV